MAPIDSTTTARRSLTRFRRSLVPSRRSLAVRTMAGVVAVVALALAALMVTTLGIAGHVVMSQLRDSLTDSWRRTASFVSNTGPGAALPGFGDSIGSGPGDPCFSGGESAPTDSATSVPIDILARNPINAPGLPVGTIAMVIGSDGTVTSAGRIDESGQRIDLDDRAVDHLLDVVRLHDEATTSRGLFKEIDFPFGRFAVRAAPIESGKLPAPVKGDGLPRPRVAGDVADFGEDTAGSSDNAANSSDNAANDADELTSGGILVLGVATDQADHTKARLLTIQLVGSFLALLAVGLGVWWWIRRSLRPLQQVSHVAAKVSEIPMASGNVDLHDYRVPDNLAQPRDEVGDVGHALNRLIDSVDSALTERSASEARLRAFVADASHELRTPLASVRGYAEMIQLTEALDANGEQLLQRVLQQAERMSALVENLLLLARLDAAEESASAGAGSANVGTGSANVDGTVAGARGSSNDNFMAGGSNSGAGGISYEMRKPGSAHPDIKPGTANPAAAPHLQKSKVFDLGELVLDAVMDATAAGRHHQWTADIPDDPVLIRGDAGQISQLLGNLLSNARKHTPEGTSVTAQLDVDGDCAVFTVTDTGPGIDPALIGKIFDRFVRGDSARTASEGSTGLGLSIVRSVARAHGGEATVSSRAGHTEFRVMLPLADKRGPAS
ncbi:MAG: HAMP domain-containing sensor histidine kinase [Ancrocorticia sp.]